jgi:hypothetical protein
MVTTTSATSRVAAIKATAPSRFNYALKRPVSSSASSVTFQLEAVSVCPQPSPSRAFKVKTRRRSTVSSSYVLVVPKALAEPEPRNNLAFLADPQIRVVCLLSRVFTVSKLSKFGKPYVVKTLSDLQAESPKELHWFLKAKVCDFHGWGTYTIARSHGYGERRGFVLVAKIRIAKEAITLLLTDPRHSVFNQDSEPYRQAYWEKDPDLRYVRVGLKRTQARPSLGSALAEYKGPNRVPEMKARGLKRAGRNDWAWKMNYLFRRG